MGIGASAGGLEAFIALLQHLPPDTGMGFVLVQHLDPDHDSALVQLLGRATSLPVREVTDNLPVEPNHVYVIPPNTNLSITAGALRLAPRPKGRAPHRSIDFFLEALAQDRRERAIGVILSGSATDGTTGLEAIKAEGGITFAQDDSARYDSMPRSAVAAGCVDFVLSPQDIAKEIERIAKHPAVAGAPVPDVVEEHGPSRTKTDAGSPLPWRAGRLTAVPAPLDRAPRGKPETRTEEALRKILLLLRNHSGVDFSLYKPSTIRRRINRRIVLSKKSSLHDYARFLRGNAGELDALYSDVLISVTSFFRNADSFEILQRKVFPALLQQRSEAPLRVWVLGCSTGQEAYSIAMTFVEAADRAHRSRKLQVFATDLHDVLLGKARNGLYSRTLVQDVSPERLKRFFVEEEGGYRVSKALREMVVFARQNMIGDPPFSRMDLITCRNLLIYLEPGLQKRLFPVLHYALNPGGFLYLGASESIGEFTDLFEPFDKKHKIYAKKGAAFPAPPLPSRKRGEPRAAKQPKAARAYQPAAHRDRATDGVQAELSAQREADRIALSQFSPPAVLVDANMQVLQFRGPTAAYLVPPAGKATFDVLKMARPGLMLPLKKAIHRARKENRTARSENVTVEQEGAPSRTTHVEVIPLKNLPERCYLIVFEDGNSKGTRPRRNLKPPRRDRAARGAEARRSEELETELTEAREYLQAVQEQYEAANEELQASSEEVQSANEELQSINEELETSKEELESANEELITVNEEMASRNAELNRLNTDLINLQSSAHLAILLLNRDLTIRRFSLQAEKLFSLAAADIGRPLAHLRRRLEMPDLEEVATHVIKTTEPKEFEVQDREGRWYSLRVHPYLTADGTVDGAVLVLMDIDLLKKSERALKDSEEYFRTLVSQVRDYAIFRTDTEGRAITWNEGVRRILGFEEDQFLGKDINAVIFTPEDVGNGVPGKELEEAARTSQADNTRWMQRRNGARFFAEGVTTALRGPKGELLGFSKVLQDQTERKLTEESRDRYARIVESSHDAIVGIDLKGIITAWNRGAEQLYGYSAEEALGQPWAMLAPPERREEEGETEEEILDPIRRGVETEPFECVRLRKDGSLLDIALIVSPIKNKEGRIVGASKISRDITERKRAEGALRLTHAELRSRADELTRFNDAAVGRELRMIELKKEVNALRERLGESSRYPLEFGEGSEDADG